MAKMKLPRPFSPRKDLALLCKTQKIHLNRAAHRTKSRRQLDEERHESTTKLYTTDHITGKRRMLIFSTHETLLEDILGLGWTAHMGRSTHPPMLLYLLFDYQAPFRKPCLLACVPDTSGKHRSREKIFDSYSHRLRHGVKKSILMVMMGRIW